MSQSMTKWLGRISTCRPQRSNCRHFAFPERPCRRSPTTRRPIGPLPPVHIVPQSFSRDRTASRRHPTTTVKGALHSLSLVMLLLMPLGRIRQREPDPQILQTPHDPTGSVHHGRDTSDQLPQVCLSQVSHAPRANDGMSPPTGE